MRVFFRSAMSKFPNDGLETAELSRTSGHGDWRDVLPSVVPKTPCFRVDLLELDSCRVSESLQQGYGN